MYLLTWPSPAFGGVLGCCHGLELPLVFNTLDAASSRLFLGDDPPRGLARDVNATWAAFARHGDPARGRTRPVAALRGVDEVDDGHRRRARGSEEDPLSEERALWDGAPPPRP